MKLKFPVDHAFYLSCFGANMVLEDLISAVSCFTDGQCFDEYDIPCAALFDNDASPTDLCTMLNNLNKYNDSVDIVLFDTIDELLTFKDLKGDFKTIEKMCGDGLIEKVFGVEVESGDILSSWEITTDDFLATIGSSLHSGNMDELVFRVKMTIPLEFIGVEVALEDDGYLLIDVFDGYEMKCLSTIAKY